MEARHSRSQQVFALPGGVFDAEFRDGAIVAAEFVHAGPFFVLNLAHGNPIIVETNTLQADEEGEHYRPAAIFRSVERWETVAPGRTPLIIGMPLVLAYTISIYWIFRGKVKLDSRSY